MMTSNSACRICQSGNLQKFLSLGRTPLANAFLRKQDLATEEPRFPLDVYLCGECSLVQLIDVVNPGLMFKNYVYFSSTSEMFRSHFRNFGQEVFRRFRLNSNSLVVDVGSNDGILLRPFQMLGARVLGVDPAENVARLATESGIETLPVFFSVPVARDIAKSRGKAHVVTATNVFAHVNDLDAFLMAVKELLEENGVFIIEVPYLADLLEKNLFDTVYHEHLSYFSVKPLITLFDRLGMKMFGLQKVDSHGGSLRVFVEKSNGTRPVEHSIRTFLEKERELNLDSLSTWRRFAEKIERNKRDLQELLQQLRSGGKRIVGYGAPAKGNTLLNYFGITSTELESIVDDSVFKQGLYTPGSHIPVVSPLRLNEDRPDYVFILAWNFADSIMNKLSNFRSAGGRFILPVPEPRIV